MIKKIDGYIIKTFLGPFFFIFSVLFFIFIVQLAWIQLDKLSGKGLDLWDITKLLFYLGVNVVQLVLPLTILLASIMTFGGFGERYEMAAIKSAGVSLARTMMPLFFIVCLLSIGLYFFSNKIVPDNQRKAKNMLFNIARTRPALNFVAGRFINDIKPFSIKVSKKYGEKGEKLDNIFMHKNATPFQNQQTVIAKNGVFAADPQNKRYLKFDLYNGFIYQNDIKGKSYEQLARQETSNIKFDTLTMYLDISDLIDKAIEKENITDFYKFYDYQRINTELDSFDANSKKEIENLSASSITSTINYVDKLEDIDTELEYDEPVDLAELDSAQKANLLQIGYASTETTKLQLSGPIDRAKQIIKNRARMILYQQRIWVFSFTCIIFFLIGAPLGAIIRKGGIGMPVVVAIIIFVVFYAILIATENMAKNNYFNPYWAAWMPNILTLPLGLFFTSKAMRDSEIFNIESYVEPLQKFFSKFTKNKEHKRYQ